MNSSSFLKLNFEQDEVVSAQRMRFLHSSRFKLLAILGLFGTTALSLQQAWLWHKEGQLPSTWYTPIYLPLIFSGVFIAVYFFAPSIDFKVNPQWRNIFDLYLEHEVFRITAVGQTQGIEKAWSNIKRVLENDKVYIMFFDSEQEFIVMPKRVLKTQEKFFQERLPSKAIWRDPPRSRQ
jgi:hypothetical protein